MKTTNYENSKKLAEIGFNLHSIRGFEYIWGHNGIMPTLARLPVQYEDETVNELVSMGFYPAYDLETLLDALPENIENSKYYFMLSKKIIGYSSKANDLVHDVFFIRYSENESLADCAARLIIKLHEQGLINFKEE